LKTILLTPTKNEEWILEKTLPIFSKIADDIIVSDQNSRDNTLNILNQFKKVKIITNQRNYHSNEVRWDLLDTARKLYGSNNLILCLDADEYIPSNLFHKHKKYFFKNTPGTAFQSPWVQLWKSESKYRSDSGVWSPKTNFKPFMFLDNGISTYPAEIIVNDHTSRIPTKNILGIKTLKIPLIHLQFANWERAQVKQVWYMCSELIRGGDATDINNKYINSITEDGLKLSKVKKEWVKDFKNGIDIQTPDDNNLWYLKEIETMFKIKSPLFFKELNIWENKSIIKIKKQI
jgi:hypothetical protein